MNRLIGSALILLFQAGISAAEPTWEIANPRPLAGEITSVSSPSGDTIWTASDGGMLVRSFDGGETWMVVPLSPVVDGRLLISFLSGAVGYVVAISNQSTPFGAVVLHTNNAGQGWRSWEVGNQEEPFHATAFTAVGTTAILAGVLPGESDQAVFYRLVNDDWVISQLPGAGIESLNNIYFFNQTIGWAVGGDGYLVSTSDAGRTWQRIPTEVQTNLFAVYYASPTTGWIGGGRFNSSQLFKTNNGGASWQEIEGLGASSKFIDIKGYQGGRVAAITRGGGDPDESQLFHSSDGRSWNQAASWEMQSLSDVSTFDETIWVVGDNGFLVRSERGDEPEVISRRATTNYLTDVSFATGAAGWAVGEHGAVLRSLDAGYDWSQVDNFPFREPIAVAGLSPWRAIVSCRGSVELLTTNGGISWREVDVLENNITSFDVDGGAIFAAGGAEVAVSGDNGASWRRSTVRPGGNVLQVNALNEQVAYAVIERDSVMVTSDGGQTWRPSIFIPPSTTALFFLDDNISWSASMAVSGSAIWATSDNWRHKERIHSLGFDVVDMAFISETEGFAVGEDGRVVKLRRGSPVESSGLLVSNQVAAIESVHNWVWICGSGGLIARWGENWLGIPNLDSDESPGRSRLVSCWPNPTNGRVVVRAEGGAWKNLPIFDLAGRRMHTIPELPSGGSVELDLTGFRSGVYFVGEPGTGAALRAFVLLK